LGGHDREISRSSRFPEQAARPAPSRTCSEAAKPRHVDLDDDEMALPELGVVDMGVFVGSWGERFT
jgi:hypothetical protein